MVPFRLITCGVNTTGVKFHIILHGMMIHVSVLSTSMYHKIKVLYCIKLAWREMVALIEHR